ncbi:MAG TPA: hypothetical protein VI796_07180 [Candidatus Thermoplasmatota archaeon]|nr:hypothetical protein [Candidatus Thermoplasmatota archaeon]
MADEEGSMAPFYIGLGVIAAIGAGYLVWRFALKDPDQREKTLDAIARAGERAKAAGQQVIERARSAGESIRHR